jgi:mutator protein MutT
LALVWERLYDVSVTAPSSSTPGQDAPRRDVAIAVIMRDGKVLVCQRPDRGSFAGYWEFPGGKREPGETVVECLRREVNEELAMRIAPVHPLRPIDHDYPNGRIRLHPYVCTTDDATPRLLACQDAKWIDPRDLKQYRFPPANDALLDEAIAYLMDRTGDGGALISGGGRATLGVSESGD